MWKSIRMLGIACLLGTAVLLACLVLLTNESQAGSGVLCVVPPGEPAGPFAACDDVFTEIQAAADTAVPDSEIWVATGVYTDVHEREGLWQMVYLDKALTLRGGYVPPFAASPDPAANPTVLDAGGQGRVVYITGTAVSLSNFHITGGNATGLGPAPSDGRGGGIYAGDTDLTLHNTVVYSNIASLNDGIGGGIAVQDGAITMTENIIRDNLAGYTDYGAGGGLSVQRSDFYLMDNAILSNTAVYSGGTPALGHGGGIAISSSQGQLVDNHIEGNVALHDGHAGRGGGIYLVHGDQVTQSYQVLIAANLIRGNIGAVHPVGNNDGEGGGIWLYGEDLSGSAPPLQLAMTNNIFQENVGTVSGASGLAGGVAVLFNTNLTFTHNTVISNTGLISGEHGMIGGLVTDDVTGTLAYNRFIGNMAAISATSGYAGGLYFYQSQIEQHNDLIQGNMANQSGAGYGGGIYFDGTAATLTNVVVTDNRADTAGAALWLGSANVVLLHPTLARNLGENAIYLTTGFGRADSGTIPLLNGQRSQTESRSGGPSVMTLTNGLLSSHSVGIVVPDYHRATINGILWHDTPIAISAGPLAEVTVNHQVVGDPLFAADGYHITAGSAAIRAGVPSGVSLDIDGEGRPFLPTLGADEYWAYKVHLPLMRKPD